MHTVLAINSGSTSTKLAVFDDDDGETELFHSSITHSVEDLRPFARVIDQARLRIDCVARALSEAGVDAAALGGIVARGGLLKPLEGGVYRVGEAMIEDLRSSRYGEHASNLAAIIARHFATAAGCGAFVVDPVVVDELDDVARPSGLPGIERRSVFHALNQKSVAREVAARMGKPYERCRFVVAHLGGGISVGAHRDGRVVDVNNALDGDGPLSPERAGGVPAGQLVDMCFEPGRTREDMRRRLVGGGGLVGYCGTNSLAEARSSGAAAARRAIEAMAYQVAKEIAMHGATLEGDVDRVVLTGGLAHDDDLVERVSARVRFLAPVEVVPGEREMVSLLRGYRAVRRGEQTAKDYTA